MENTFKYPALIFSLFVIVLFLSSCGKDNYIEKRSGPWKITKVEQAWYYTGEATSPDSLVTYENDTLGYFNFYHTDFGLLYILIKYPSAMLWKDYDARYEVHPNNHEMLLIQNWQGVNQVDVLFAVNDPNKNKQQLTAIKGWGTGGIFRESIFVEKQ